MRISSLRSTYLVLALVGLICIGVLTTYYMQRQSGPLIYAAADLGAGQQSAVLIDQLPSGHQLGTSHGQDDSQGNACPDPSVDVASHKGSATAPTAVADLVDLNSATADELTRLPGIGPAYAQRIIALRELRSGFVYKEELLDVSGIGPARYAELVDLITVGPYNVPNEHSGDL